MTIPFFDMDGFLADFDGGFERRFGHHPERYKDNKKGMWDLVNSVPDFFATLPMIKGADSFIDWYCWSPLMDVLERPMILTACPHSNYHDVATQKKFWVQENLSGHFIVLPAYGSEAKPAFMQNPGDILIDDWGKNCKAWEDAGGVAIKFENDWEYVKERLIGLV